MISTVDPLEQRGALQQKSEQQQRRITELEINERILELKMQKLRMLWARKSERIGPAGDTQKLLFTDPAGETTWPAGCEPRQKSSRAIRKAHWGRAPSCPRVRIIALPGDHHAGDRRAKCSHDFARLAPPAPE